MALLGSVGVGLQTARTSETDAKLQLPGILLS